MHSDSELQSVLQTVALECPVDGRLDALGDIGSIVVSQDDRLARSVAVQLASEDSQ